MNRAREIAVYKQGLHRRPDTPDLHAIVRQIGLLQLDSINVTARSHYLVMLSRAGLYDPADLDALLNDGHLFEGWAHAASLIPTEHHDYFQPVIHARRDHLGHRYERMGDDPQATIDAVMAAVRENGPMSSQDFETPRQHKGSWWNWKPAKIALEYLFDRGYLMVSYRESFRRYYDLAERVLDGRTADAAHSVEDYERWAAERGLRHQGMATANEVADYYRLNKTHARRYLADLVASGTVQQMDDYFIHRDDLPLLDMDLSAELTTFLSPFDNLIWHRQRVETLFDFYYRVEMYTPAAKRTYGYYVLPILHRGRLVGRIDPKIDRKAGRFIIRALHLEDGITLDDDLVAGLARAVREFMAFHGCDDFVVEGGPDAHRRIEMALTD